MFGNRADHGLTISQRRINPRAIHVRFGGELTAQAAGPLAKWVGQVCGSRARGIHADMSRLRYIDEPGAWVLTLALQCIRYNGHPVEIYNVQFPLRRALDSVGVDPGGSAGFGVGGAYRNVSGLQSASPFDRDEREYLDPADPQTQDWLAMEILMCDEAPQLASMFAIFDQLGCGYGPPARAVFRAPW